MKLLKKLYLTEGKKEEYLATAMGPKLEKAIQDDQSARPFLHKVSGVAVGITPLTIVSALRQADPTVGADYLNFIVRMYVQGQFRFEDIARIKDDLTEYTRVRPKLENKDLNSYKTLDDLYAAVEPFKKVEVVSKKEEERQLKNEEAEKLIDSPNFKVIIPRTHAAACIYSAGTKWCTGGESSKETFQSYHKQGPLIIVIAKQGAKLRKFQFHFESQQFMNELDRPIADADKKFLSKYPEYSKLIEWLIEKYYSPHFQQEMATAKKQGRRPDVTA